MEQNKQETVQTEWMEKVLPIETNTEITLPDYRSEISRLLWVRPRVMPPASFIGGGKADFSGACFYDILYVGPDGCLYGETREDSYAFSLPMEKEGAEIFANVTPESLVSRVLGPRKLSLRCRMRADVKGYAKEDLSVKTTGEGERGNEILYLSDFAESGEMLPAGRESFEVSDVISTECEGDLRLISTHGDVFLEDVSAGMGAAHCRGEAIFHLLLSPEGEKDAEPYPIVQKVRFENDVPVEDMTPDSRVTASGCLSDIRAEIEEGKILLGGRVTLSARGERERPVALVQDIFLPGMTADRRYREEKIWRAGACCNQTFSVSGDTPYKKAGVTKNARILDSFAEAQVREQTAEDGKTVLAGDIVCHVLCDEGGEYSVAEIRFPFRCETKGEFERVNATAEVPLCRVSAGHDGLRADAEVQLSLVSTTPTPVRVLREATFTPAEPRSRSDIEICYPAPGDTLWSVSCRYGLSPETLAGANGISAEAPGESASLEGVKFLLIP